MEWRLFDEGETPFVSTLEFHHDRDRAPHLEQVGHQPRLFKAAEYVMEIAQHQGGVTVSDLGCGDGGLLSLVQMHPFVTEAWGYDFTPANAAAWTSRGVEGMELDFVNYRRGVSFGDVTIMTETLEHLADPHEIVRWVATGSKWLVASSPAFETDTMHDGLHAWAWDQSGYAALLEQGGYLIIRHELAASFQVIMGELP